MRAMRDECQAKYGKLAKIIEFEDWLNQPAIRVSKAEGSVDYTYIDLILDGGIDEVVFIAEKAFG